MKRILMVMVLVGLAIMPARANEAQAVLGYLANPDAAGIVVVQGLETTGIGVPISWRLGDSPVSFDLLFVKSDEGGLTNGSVAELKVFPGLSLTTTVNTKLNLHAFAGVCIPSKEYGPIRVGEFDVWAAVYFGLKQSW